MLKRIRNAVCAAWMLFGALAPMTPAQTGQTAVQGTVRDQSGGLLAGVPITARSLQTRVSISVATDGRGSYEIRQLTAGTYEIEAAQPGFSKLVETVTIAEGETRSLDLVLEIAPLSETVTVTRTGQYLSYVPEAVTVVLQDEIQFAQRKASPDEALRSIPGLFVANRRNYSLSGGVRLSIRAPLSSLGMRGLQLIQDGIPLTTADGTTQPTNLDLGSAGQFEVIRGPSSVLYGNSAGGVISARTEFPPSSRLKIQPDIQFGSYGYQRQELKTAGTSGTLGYVFNLSRLETDGFREHSHAEVRQANLVIRKELSPNTELSGIFNLFDMPFGESSSTLTATDARNNPRTVRQLAIDQGWGESSRQGQGGLTLEHRFGENHVYRVTGWGMWRDVWNPIPFRIIDLGRIGAGFRSEYQGRGTLGSLPVEWTAGVDLSYQRDDREEFENLGVSPGAHRTREGTPLLHQLEDVLSVAPFAQLSIALRPRWHFTAGARYDYYDFSATDYFLSDGDQSGSRTMHAASPKVGITFVATDWLDLYANFATAYQTPTTVELSNRPTGEGGFNEDLEPANLKSFEFGARGFFVPWRLRFEATGYFSALDNAFVSYQRPDEQTFFRNAGESTRNGSEVLLEWTPLTRLGTRLAYTYQDFEFRRFVTDSNNFSGNRETGAPPHQLFVGANYETSFGLRSGVQVRWVDSYPVNNANTFFNWSYRLVDLRFGLRRDWHDIEIRPFFGVDNLFDLRYNASTSINAVGNRFYEPAPGREIYVGISIGAGIIR